MYLYLFKQITWKRKGIRREILSNFVSLTAPHLWAQSENVNELIAFRPDNARANSGRAISGHVKERDNSGERGTHRQGRYTIVRTVIKVLGTETLLSAWTAVFLL